jgi:hypothetical protein
MPEFTPQENTSHSLFKELSDIKASMAVNTAETQNIKTSIIEIRNDIKEIKDDFVNRREFTEGLTAVREEITPLKKVVYGIIGLIVTGVIVGLLKLIINK